MVRASSQDDDAGGCVVITRFECRSLLRLLYLMLKHSSTKRAVRRSAKGYVDSVAIVDWRQRTLISVSLWRSVASIFSMGEVREHVFAARLPRKLGIATTCGIYKFAGDWRSVMFGTFAEAHSPLERIATESGLGC